MAMRMVAETDEAGAERPLPHELDRGLGDRARIGLIVLATDQTIEHEWRLILGGVEGVALYAARLWNDPIITPASLAAMAGEIGPAARTLSVLPAGAVVAFGCTSASMVLGEHAVADLVRRARPQAVVTTPIGAAFAALRAQRARRLAVLTPYRADVNARVRAYIEAAGFAVPVFGSFAEEDDDRAARITPASIRDAAITLGRDRRVDAVFVACTSLRVAAVVAEVEEAIGKPVTSSNHAMAWHALRLAGVTEPLPRWGRLFAAGLPG